LAQVTIYILYNLYFVYVHRIDTWNSCLVETIIYSDNSHSILKKKVNFYILIVKYFSLHLMVHGRGCGLNLCTHVCSLTLLKKCHCSLWRSIHIYFQRVSFGISKIISPAFNLIKLSIQFSFVLPFYHFTL